MARGFVYLVAVVDWFSRRVLSHRVSITMDADFCVEALQEALAKHGKPEIFNTDQGSQITSEAFTGVLKAHEIGLSMDGKGTWRNNVFVERIWKSVKYEEVYLRAYDSVGQARTSLGRYLDFYNSRRPHSSLDRRTPDEAYFNQQLLRAAAWIFRRLMLVATPVGLRPPCAATTTQQPALNNRTRQKPTYLSRETVQTTGASSLPRLRHQPDRRRDRRAHLPRH